MIKSYEVLLEKNNKKLISINEENTSTEIVCNENNSLQEAILCQNKRNLLTIKKKELLVNLKKLKNTKKLQLISMHILDILSVIAIGNFFNTLPTILSIGQLGWKIFCATVMITASLTLFGLAINTIKEVKKTKNDIINLQTLLHNVDMMITRTCDKLENNKKVKQEYFKQDKNNIHLTHICVDKIEADLNKSIYDRWYGLNHDTCTKIIQTAKKRKVAKEKMRDVFAPVSLNTMDTEQFVKNKVYTKSR